MSTLDDWTLEVALALNLPAESIPADLRNALLDLTRDVAHGVTRVAGPLTTYLVGVAVGRGAAASAVIPTLTDLVRAHESANPDTDRPEPEVLS